MQGHYTDAIRILTEGASANLADKNRGGSTKVRGDRHAQSSARRGRRWRRPEKVLGNSEDGPIEFLAAPVDDAGEFAKAETLMATLEQFASGNAGLRQDCRRNIASRKKDRDRG